MKKRKICALVVSCAMLVSLLPTTIFAEEDEDAESDAVEITEAEPEEETSDSADVVIGGGGTVSLVTEDEEEADTEENADEAEPEEEEPEEDAEDIVYRAESGSVRVEVTAPADALPEDAKLSVERYAKDSANYRDAAEAIDLDEGSDMAALDISFLVDGEEVEPSEPVKVSIDVSDILPEDADASTLEVQHLVETPDQTIKPVVVANESSATEGTINENKATAEFEVESFSSFTVSWTITTGPQAGSSYTVNVTAYLDGTELDGITGLTFSSENDELDFETLLSDVDYGTGDYTFSYATGTIGNVAYGSEENSIAAVEIVTGTGTGAGGGQTTYFRIVYMDGSYVDVATSSDLNISAYYTTPSLTVEIVAVDEDEAEDWELQAVVSHAADGATLSYEWWVTDTDGNDTELAYVANTDNTGQAFIVWSGDVKDNDEVVVHVKVTATDASGNTETAEASYTLEYGDETVDLIMTYGPDQTALPAGVTVTLTNEATGDTYDFETSDDGWVHDAVIEPGIYIVSATYTVDGNTYQCNEEISLHDAGNYSINLNYYNPDILTSVPDKDDWEHIDIKLSIGTSGSASAEGVTLDITSATIYTSTGEVRATTTSVTGNDNEFQLHWSTGDGNTHATSFSSTDYIVINYTLTENGVETAYSITIGPDTVYAAGTTYPVDGQRAYKLYNYLYGTSYESDAQLIAAGIGDIDISGMSLFLVAAILCDSSEVTGAGQLDVSSAQAGLDFALSINTINELATSWQFEVEKTYYNASMLAGNFEFVLYDASSDGDTWIQGSANSTLTNSQAGIGQEGYSQDTMESLAIAYSDEDIQNGATYYYILTETPNTVTSESGAIITFDETVFGIKVQLGKAGEGDDETATVTVTYYILEGSNGTYTASEYTGEKIDINSETGEPTFKFENTYQAYVDISGSKVWEDGGLTHDNATEITLEVTRSSGSTSETLADTDFVVVWDGDNFTIYGSYDEDSDTYTGLPMYSGIIEWEYSVGEVSVPGYTTTITYDNDGNLVITNTLDEVPAEISVSKSYVDTNGDDVETWPEDGFTFTLTAISGINADGDPIEADDVPMPEDTEVTAYDTDSVSFGEIDYTAAGTYYYQITESASSEDYIAIDTSYHYAKVVVTTGDTGELNVTVSYLTSDTEVGDITADGLDWNDSITSAVFTNTYSAAGSVSFTAKKQYTGAELTEGLFTFIITETTEGADYTETVMNDANGGITFPAIEYTLADVGTHTYVIVEENGDAGGVTYDPTEINVTVVVEDAGDGTLSITVTADDAAITAEDGSYNVGTFENSYEATGSVTFGGEKKISGKDEETSQQFTFELYTTDSSFTVAEDAEATDTKTVTGAGSFTFGTISYDSEEEGKGAGTYYYLVKETSTDENGWTMDTKEYRITVVVTDAGNGTFELTVTCVDAEGQTVVLTGTDANGVYNFTGLDFTNEYEPAPTSVQFTGSKYITNSASDSDSTDKVFTFELYNADSSFTTSGGAIQTKTTTGAGTISFDEIEYKETGTYYYVIQEVQEEASGWTMDSNVYNITVEVTDDGLGQLVATVTVNGTVVSNTDDSDVYGGFDFTNAYAAEGAVTLGVVKSISSVASTDKTFSFTLFNSDEDFATGDSIETITTDGTIENSTSVNFSEITYDAAGTYYYVIKETGTAPDGWTLDTKEYHVTVTATDNGDGTITTSAAYEYVDENEDTQTENSAAFTNTYAATGELALTGTKTLVGGTLNADDFSFTMADSTGASVGVVTMDASGNITFPTLTYDETDIGGEYTYTIAESSGESRGAGIEYDDTTYKVVVSVADNGDGTLDVTYTVNGTEEGAITFTNYQRGSLIISKTFTGLSDEQIASLTDFTITVKNSSGDTVKTLMLEDATKGDGGVYTWTVNNLPADTYIVTESGYSLDGYEVIAKSGEVTITDGSDVSVNDELAWGGEDSVEFTNDYTEVGTITISKYVVAESDIQEAHEDTEYTVVITASEDADFQWVTVTSSLGREITPTIDGKIITFTVTENETVTIDGLPAGEYTVEEQGSDAMTSEHCVPSYRIDDEETEEAPTVTVASGSENVVEVEIDNEYPIGTYIQVQKNYNKDEYPSGDDAFTFTIEALSAALDDGETMDAKDMPMPTNSTVTITSDDGGYIGLITFDDEENEFEHFGTYYYKITETKGSLDNVEYDESVHYVKVVVSFDEDSHEITTDEWEAKADEETNDYKNLTYTEAGIVTAEFTNTAYEELSLEKEVSGTPGDTSEYEFEIELINSDGTPFEGTVEYEDGSDNLTFEEGKATVTITAGEKITIMVPSGVTCTVTEVGSDADSVNVSVNGVYQAQSSTTEATAEVGTIADSTQVVFVNSYRAYFPIDEEIVTDTDDIFDRDAWVKDESVNEYNAIEIEMTTNLPVITAYDLANGDFTMNFHEVLDSHLNLDENTGDFSVYIGGNAISTSYYKVTFDNDDGCDFHVDVDLTALFNDGVVTEDMLDGNTEITIFFFADLEGTNLNGSYTSTIWYEVQDDGEVLYTSNTSVVAVYTYEIEIEKYDISDDSEKLAGATFGVYYDKDCTEPVYRYVGEGFDDSEKQAYTVTSEDNGYAMFYGLAEGTYYVKELKAPNGYVLSDEILTIELSADSTDDDHIYHDKFANTPEEPHYDEEPWKAVDTDGDGNFNDDGVKVNVGDKITYAINYYNNHDDAETVVITDTLDYALDFVSATDGGKYDADTRTITWTIKDAEPGWGYVYFTATVNDIALVEEEIENTASVKVGNDAAQDTNMVANPTPDSSEAGVPGSGTPKTGDENHPLAWTLLLLASMLAMGTAYAMKKQSRRRIRNRK